MKLNETEYASLIQLADRIWDAAWKIDELRGDAQASEWTAFKVRDLWRQGRAHDEGELLPLLRVLEGRLKVEESSRQPAKRHDTEMVLV